MRGTGIILETGYYIRNMTARSETIQPDTDKQVKEIV